MRRQITLKCFMFLNQSLKGKILKCQIQKNPTLGRTRLSRTRRYTSKNLTTCQQDVFATGLKQASQQVVTMLLF
jgi:hypothetical protein